jgi:hypothetical protein
MVFQRALDDLLIIRVPVPGFRFIVAICVVVADELSLLHGVVPRLSSSLWQVLSQHSKVEFTSQKGCTK